MLACSFPNRGPNSMTYNCAVALSSGIIELRVVYGQSVWAWLIISAEAQTLDRGVGTSKEAAQLSSQRAFEERLRWAGMNQQAPKRYEWKRAFERD